MKKSIFFLAALLTLSFAACSDKNEPSNDAASGEQSGGSGQFVPTADVSGDGWEYVAYRNILRITKSGAMDNYTEGGAPWSSFSEAIKSIEFATDLTSIGAYAFYNCSSIETITIKKAVTSIGKGAFKNCYSLKTLTFEDDSELTAIGAEAFRACSALTAFKIPDAVTALGDYTFANCTALRSFSAVYESDLESVGAYAFYKSGITSMPLSVSKIGQYAFAECSSLKTFNAVFPIKEIGDHAFYNAVSLEELIFPIMGGGTTKAIPESLCEGCVSLAKVKVNNSIQTIGARAFYGCTKLAKVGVTGTVSFENANFRLSYSLKSIGEYAFYNCKALTEINVGYVDPNNSSTTSSYDITVGDYAFSGCDAVTSITFATGNTHTITLGRNVCEKCSNTTTIALTSVKSMGVQAFKGCSKLKTLALGKLEVIPAGSFRGLTKLTDVKTTTGIDIYAYQNDVLKTIGTAAFKGCTALKNVVDCWKLASIGDSAFADCSVLNNFPVNSLDNPTNQPVAITYFGTAAFYNCEAMRAGRVAVNVAERIRIPIGTTKIGKSAFTNCSSLISVKLPSSLQTVGDYAFNYCSKLATVYCYATEAPSMYQAFASIASTRKLLVPSASISKYTTQYSWDYYFTTYKDTWGDTMWTGSIEALTSTTY